ncbi:MAG: hypothetical protein LBC42_02940 [Puniceicoccales bacterium]|nr:hypothetical protein [Puniceicoccales bacterium]
MRRLRQRSEEASRRQILTVKDFIDMEMFFRIHWGLKRRNWDDMDRGDNGKFNRSDGLPGSGDWRWHGRSEGRRGRRTESGRNG